MNVAALRDELLTLLEGGSAHVPFKHAVADFPIDQINLRVPDIPYSAWELSEHMRIAQFDILDFIQNANYVKLKWPDDTGLQQVQKRTKRSGGGR